MMKPLTVLFAVTGMSPAVLTETIWALAQENPPVIPHRIVVVTTKAGRAAIRRELFSPVETDRRVVRSTKQSAGRAVATCPGSIWDALVEALKKRGFAVAGKLRFGTTADDIRVFTRADARGHSAELDDIRTPSDNEAAADFLLDKLREFTENQDVRLVCSMAGGRKTMGVLLFACLSLIGREQDRLTHVLVNEPFDDPRLGPRFYFPTVPTQRHCLPAIGNRKSQITNSRAARVELADVPFVPLRNLFPRELGRLPGSFMNLVQKHRTVIEHLAAPPRVLLRDDEPVAVVEGRPVRLSATSFALLSFLVDRARRGQPAFLGYKDAIDSFKDFLRQWSPADGTFDFRYDAAKSLAGADDATIRKLVNNIATALRNTGVSPNVISHLCPHRGHFGIRIAASGKSLA